MIQSSQANIFDTRALKDLQRDAKQHTPASNKAIAQQFEALFTQMMLKSMRQTVQAESVDGSESMRFFQDLHDQQLSLSLSKQGGIGLATALERLMNGQTSPTPATYDFKGSAVSPGLVLPDQQSKEISATANEPLGASPQSFIGGVWQQAQDAARSLGVPTHFLVAQAALETGWGKSQIRRSNGSPSYNLFNIKAGKNWTGPVAEATTIEYENGKSVSRVERFRAYDSYADSFADYAKLLGKSSRYANVLGKTDAKEFASALQSAGYATDPGYASKLVRVINGASLRRGMLASAS